VLHDKHRAGWAGDSANARENCICAWRCEDIPRDRGSKHSGADIAGVGWLVAAAATGNHSNLALLAGWQRVAYNDCFRLEQRKLRVLNGQALQHLSNDGARIVYKLLHGGSFPRLPKKAGGPQTRECQSCTYKTYGRVIIVLWQEAAEKY